MEQQTSFIRIPPIPSVRSLMHLFLGGYVALMAWEIFSRTLTVWVVGGPLEPPALVLSLFNQLTGGNYEQSMALPWANATFAHYVIGIVGYPILYYIISRGLKHWDIALDALVWGAMTIFALYSITQGTFLNWIGVWIIVTLTMATRFVNPSPPLRNCLSFGNFTWLNALGIMAPIAGLPFLLLDGAETLSFMSWAGHVLFGFIIAYVFEQLEVGGFDYLLAKRA